MLNPYAETQCTVPVTVVPGATDTVALSHVTSATGGSLPTPAKAGFWPMSRPVVRDETTTPAATTTFLIFGDTTSSNSPSNGGFHPSPSARAPDFLDAGTISCEFVQGASKSHRTLM